METLLCDEVWASSPVARREDFGRVILDDHWRSEGFPVAFYTTEEEEYEEAFKGLMEKEKERCYLLQPEYFDYLQKENLVSSRLWAIQWLIKSRSRLNLSFGTLFHAANYLDRFISMNRCSQWSFWMVELLSIACLSVASKFNETETNAPSLNEIVMDKDLDHSFEAFTIQQMELKLLQSLEWRLSSPTSYSYFELLTWKLDAMKVPRLHEKFSAQIKNLLFEALIDLNLMEFTPSVVAVSAICWSLNYEHIVTPSEACVSYITRIFNQEQKEEMVRFYKLMEEQSVDERLKRWRTGGFFYYDCPSSPTTVLLKERNFLHDIAVNHSTTKKRKRE